MAKIGSGWRLAAGALLFAGTLGCWQIPAREKFQRTEEMVDHQQDMVAVRDAIRADDLEAAKAAAKSLARPDWFPGLGSEAKEGIAAVRADADKLSEAATLDEAATGLTALTAKCAACHHQQGIAAPAAWTGDPEEPLWIGLVWEDQAKWAEGAKGKPALEGAKDWPARRAAVATAL